MIINVKYRVKWVLTTHPHYVWTECKKLINTKTGRELKRTLKGNSAGYWLPGGFIKLDDLRQHVKPYVAPQKNTAICPFSGEVYKLPPTGVNLLEWALKTKPQN